jgi:hypothetical protein
MKRTLAFVALLTALGVLCKLAWKERVGAPAGLTARTERLAGRDVAPDPARALEAKYPADAALIARVLRDYHHNALSIEQSDGRRGLVLLDRLGLEAVFLYEKYPKEFRRLAGSLSDDSAADVLLHWREYFGLKRADDVDRGILIAEVSRLGPATRRLAAKYPNALPLILAEPAGVCELIERLEGDPDELRDALVVLDFISLDRGAADLRAALRTLDEYGPLALDAFRLQGPDGFALVKLYGSVLQALGDALPLEDALILLRVNAAFVDERLATHAPETVAGYLRHVAAAGLIEEIGGSPHALRLSVEFGPAGDKALAQAGADAADVVFDEYPDVTLRDQAVAALAEHGSMALVILSKYAPDPDFGEILRRYGPRVIVPVAQSDPAPEQLAALRAKDARQKSWAEVMAQGVLALSRDNGQATIRLIRSDGIERVESLNSTGVEFYQFLPLYDLLHLGRVVSLGQTPTGGELSWALVDGCFVVADALSLAVLQPEGIVASEAARSEVKAVGREALQAAGRGLIDDAAETGGKALVRDGTQATAERLSRWWTVRMAGGTYRVLRRLPEAIGKLGVADLARMGRPLCEKAGLRLSTFAPLRFLKDGVALVRSIPPGRGVKYVAAQALQAGVGVVGFAKMEEHLRSRRP